jgi:hypothetical protein
VKSERRPKLSTAEASAIAQHMKKNPKVLSVVQRFSIDGDYPVVIVRAKNGRYFSIVTDTEYSEILRVLDHIR